jgi:hypothetical protein
VSGQKSESSTAVSGWMNPRRGRSRRALVSLTAAAIGMALLAGAAPASAAKQAIAYFGTESGAGSLGGQFKFPTDIAVNSTGAGPADRGDIYVVEGFFEEGDRIQRFAQNENGTPADPYDDTYEFVAAWGADVDATPSGGNDYEICTVASECKFGVRSPGNGTPAGNGTLAGPRGIDVDQDTGNVYVSDGEARVSVYSGDGTFLRSLGWDVVESGPDNAGTGYEVCVAANGDVCKAGARGSGLGQMKPQGFDEMVAVSPPDGNPATGKLVVADGGNHRVDTFNLDGSNPASFGTEADFGQFSPGFVAVDSRGIIYVSCRKNKGQIARYDSENANGGGVGFLAPIAVPPLLSLSNGEADTAGMRVDPDTDGAGPDSDVLYTAQVTGTPGSGLWAVQQFGPLNAPGLTTPPVSEDAVHGSLFQFPAVGGLGLDYGNGRLFVSLSEQSQTLDGNKRSGVYVLDAAGGIPTVSLDSLSDITASTVTVHGSADPNGPPPVSYRIEYSTNGTNWVKSPETAIGTQDDPQDLDAVLDPPSGGLEPNTFYHVRLVVTKAFTPSVVSSELTFTTLPDAPAVETVGAPIRTTTGAQLNGRVNPRNSDTTFHFEYGPEGPCDLNPCLSTPAEPAGSGNLSELVSAPIAELEPGTTYHYRLVADNGQPGFGADMTVSTRSSEAPLAHGHFPGPVGSDRAWELVSASESGGNPVDGAAVISDDGSRAVWGLGGGSPLTDSGGFNELYSERTPEGWQAKYVYPPRDEQAGPNWHPPIGRSDLSSFAALNFTVSGDFSMFRVTPGGTPVKLYEWESEDTWISFEVASDDGSRVLLGAAEDVDPAHPAPGSNNLYDVSTPGEPHLVSLLPGEVVASCGVPAGAGSVSPYGVEAPLPRSSRWISADGEFAFFLSSGNNCSAPPQLYVRDFGATETKLLSGPALSGLSCGTGFIRSNAEAAFFWTKTRLTAEDTAPFNCSDETSDADVYRYDLDDGSLKCVTCVVAGADADVYVGGDSVMRRIAVAEDGSRLYFASASRLLPGAASKGYYRLDVKSGNLAYLGRVGEGKIGLGSAMTSDGSLLFFSSSDPSLNPLGGGAGNAGTEQLYRYDDNDRSLVCVSCPQDGSAPRAAASAPGEGLDSANMGTLSRDGSIFAFNTPTPLVDADQNTAPVGQDPVRGQDVYEWRDGRLLLVSDGLLDWTGPDSAPGVRGMSPSGKDILFTAATQYTPDALDNFRRLYDSRIGGGIEFPKAPPPCPLEVCQGTPKGVPEEAVPGSGSFSGPGNATQPKPSRCSAGKRKVRRAGKTRCVATHPKKAPHKRAQKNRASHDRRTAR